MNKSGLKMMSIMRKRREAERAKKLEDVFREADVNNSGKITTEQLVKLFHANDVFCECHDNANETLCFDSSSISIQSRT